MNDSKDTLSIGEVSEICHISIKTLRYYDKIGLLKPAYVDSVSRYRYYSKSQLSSITFFKEMKLMGFSSDELRGCFDNKEVTSEKVIALLDKKMSQIDKQLEELQSVKQRLAISKQLLQEMKARSPGDISVIHKPSRLVAFIRSRLKWEYDAATAKFIELFHLARKNDLVFKGSGMTVLYDNYQVIDHKDVEIEFCWEVFADKSYNCSFIREIPSGLYASIIHEGDYFALLTEAYPRLYEWIKQHKYEPIGPAFNVHLSVPEGRRPKKGIVEVQVPIKRIL